MAYDTIHASGNGEIETPNLDRLAARSTTFTHAYNMGSWSGAVCVASRTMLLTGRSVWRAGASYEDTDTLFREEGKRWPQLLGKVGYETYFTGEWHVKANLGKLSTMSVTSGPACQIMSTRGITVPSKARGMAGNLGILPTKASGKGKALEQSPRRRRGRLPK